MQRVTIRVPEQQAKKAEVIADNGFYPNRSELIRAALRELLEEYDVDLDQGRARKTPGYSGHESRGSRRDWS